VLQALEGIGGTRRLDFEDIVTARLRKKPDTQIEIHVNWAPPHQEIKSLVRCRQNGQPGLLDFPQGLTRQATWLHDNVVRRIRVFSLDAKAISHPVALKKDLELSNNGAGLAGVLDRLRDHDEERFEALNEELGRWLPEFDRVSFDLDANGNRVIFLRTRDGRHEIPAADLSQGTLIALAILTLAYLPEPPSIVGLEEPDRGLHPYLLRRVQDAIYRLSNPESCGETREPVQVIATTHNPYFLDLFKDHPEEIVVANKVGTDVQFERVTDRPHFKDILGEAPLGEAWFTGFLGGVPSGS